MAVRDCSTRIWKVNAVGGDQGGAAIHLINSSSVITDVTASAIDGYGIYASQSNPQIDHARIIVQGSGNGQGVSLANISNVNIHNSIISATHSIVTSQMGIVSVANTKLSGPVWAPNGGIVRCAGVYDDNYNFFANTCSQ